ncbi:MAG: enoyl-CoA hydratase/isomerase family protein, partial [Bermanella sp.]
MTEAIRFEKDSDNIVTLTMDLPGQGANIMNKTFNDAYKAIVLRIEQEADSISGIIIASAKKTFFAGGDLNDLINIKAEQASEYFAEIEALKAPMRTLETLGKPVVAAINGAALGGGLEICLACHHRVAIDTPKTKLGLPEVGLGLLPGGGGVARMVRMLGLEAAFKYLLEGKQVNPQTALKDGIIDELASDAEDMMAKARAWILANPQAAQSFDAKGYRMPGGTPLSPKVAQMLAMLPSILRKKT